MPVAPAGWQHIIITTCLLSLAILTTVLRIPSRRRVRLAVGADDWTLWIALGLVGAMYVEGLIWVVYGGIGKHFVNLSSKEIEILFKFNLICWLTYPATFIATKISILLLYVRIFPVIRIRIACIIVGFLVSAHGLSIFMVICLQCRPFAFIWNKTIPGGVCLPFERVFYGIVMPTILLTAIVVCVPMPVVWKLHMRWTQKLALIAIFASGGLVCVAGAFRMASIRGFDPQDLSYAIAPAAKLIIIEPCVAIICVGLPTIGPALQDIAAYSTIEYYKMIRRIRDAVAPEQSPSVERAKVYTPMAMREDKFDLPVMSLPWASELLEEDSGEISPPSDTLGDISEKPAMARGRWSSVG